MQGSGFVEGGHWLCVPWFQRCGAGQVDCNILSDLQGIAGPEDYVNLI